MSTTIVTQTADWIAKLPGTPFVYVAESGLFYHLGGDGLPIEMDVLRTVLQGQDTKSEDRSEYKFKDYCPVGPDLRVLRNLLTSVMSRLGHDSSTGEDEDDEDEQEARLLCHVAEATKPLVSRTVHELTQGLVGVGPRPPSAPRPDETFARWLRRQHGRNDRVGDIATDLRRDQRKPSLRSIETFVTYLEDIAGASEAAIASAWEAWSEYKTGFKSFPCPSTQGPLIALVRQHAASFLSELRVLQHVYGRNRKLVAALKALDDSVNRVAEMFGPIDLGPRVRLPNSLTLADHVRIGATLKGFHRAAQDLWALHAGCLSPDHQACSLLREDTIDTAKCLLDDVVCDEHPESSNQIVLHCYYGAAPRPDALAREGVYLDA